jgi:hypothetical protein
MTLPRVSVLLPICRSELFVATALASVVRHTFTDWGTKRPLLIRERETVRGERSAREAGAESNHDAPFDSAQGERVFPNHARPFSRIGNASDEGENVGLDRSMSSAAAFSRGECV